MKVSMMKVFEEAKDNESFKNELKKSGETEFSEPAGHWKYEAKYAFASIYIGWMIGRGLFNSILYS